MMTTILWELKDTCGQLNLLGCLIINTGDVDGDLIIVSSQNTFDGERLIG